ncbi:hypothetical protein H4R18_003293 [Coemansia javaensis]|uniref:Uncharacterized protein n=1 Tax=Coemansia javaensis TaxID=2761396 RepID=A0A9W8HCK0_9FUNG|nr:hypothetical protein H4R18_003293 [Coemansia javaensis]
MSGYSAIGDHAPPSHNKAEHGRDGDGGSEHRYSSHPYMSGYAQRPESEAIRVDPDAGGLYGGEPTAGPSTFASHDGGQRISRYETSLALRYDVEAALAYALGVFSGAFLLVLEKKNDYVRFHAWQSALLSAAGFAALVVAALVSDFLYWLVLLGMLGVSAYMARRAYLDGAVFERFALPYIGPLAAQLVDEE